MPVRFCLFCLLVSYAERFLYCRRGKLLRRRRKVCGFESGADVDDAAFPAGYVCGERAGLFAYRLLLGAEPWRRLDVSINKAYSNHGLLWWLYNLSTFISEGTALAGDHNFGWLALYTFGSLVVGFVCVLAGHSVARAL